MIRWGSTQARWTLLATVLGSGMAFLDGTVVNVALRAIDRDLDAGLAGLQWILDAYLVTLGALLLIGGALGDRYGRRRVFAVGLVGFTVASLLCGIAPTTATLVAARAVQGVAAALLVPGSLAILSASFHPDDRGRAIGAWSGLSGVSTAIGPFLGGWLVDAASWRWVFLVNLPFAAAALVVTLRFVPESRDEAAGARPDVAGALLAAAGLGAVAFALIEREPLAGVVGVVALAAFLVVEARVTEPMLPLSLFRSPQFSGANLTTLAVYGALGGATFLLVLQLQVVAGWTALMAGAALVPITLLLLVLSTHAGAFAARNGPRLPMTLGPLLVAAGMWVLAGVDADAALLGGPLLPGTLLFGLGMAVTVAPLTTAVLGAVEDRHVGVGSGVNNAVARVAGLLAVAVLPGLVGLELDGASTKAFASGYAEAMRICAGLCVLGAVASVMTVTQGSAPEPEKGVPWSSSSSP